MSSLAAVFHRDGRPAEEYPVWAMLDAVPYRGLDGSWVARFGETVLGYARMSVTPEDDLGIQPYASRMTGCAVIADVRLDNRVDLIRQLSAPSASEVTDAELILRAYERWGLQAAERLLGDFAYIIWDPTRRRIVAARDTSGRRQLFYRIDARMFAAASEIHQLFQDPSVPVEPNDGCIRESLVPLNMVRNEKDLATTYYAGIHAVPAGHTLVVDRDVFNLRQYWDIADSPSIRYRTDEEYAEHFRDLFFKAVKARLRSKYPLGAMLSGGLDSGSVVCTAQELFETGAAVDPGFTSFTLDFGPMECDERPFIEAMQARYGFNARFLPSEQISCLLSLEPSGFQESPTKGASEKDSMLEAAGQSGVRVLLTGDFGDAAVGGSRIVFDSLLKQGQLRAFWRNLQSYRRLSDDSLLRIVGAYCVAPLLPMNLQRQLMVADTRRLLAPALPHLLPRWMPQTLRNDLSRRHHELCVSRERARRFSNSAQHWEHGLLSPPETLLFPSGWPVEIACPYADRRLLEFLIGIPPEQKFSPHAQTDEFYAGSKRIVRNAMRGTIPETLRTRTSKTVFTPFVRQQIERWWPVYEAAFGPRGKSLAAQRGYIDQSRFWSRLQELRSGAEAHEFGYIRQIWCLETWLRALELPRPQRVSVESRSRTIVERPWSRSSTLARKEVSHEQSVHTPGTDRVRAH